MILKSFEDKSSEKGDSELGLSLKWMMERCGEDTEWLLENAGYIV